MKFQPRSNKTRQYIIESTAAVFNKKGYAGTSLTDLTEATKLTKGSIYGNFENKEAVAAAVLDYNISKQQVAITQKVAEATTWKDKLLVHATAYTSKFKLVVSEGGCPFLNCGTEADDTNETLRQRVADGLQKWKASITNIITGGIEAGDFKQDTNAAQMAISLIALTEGGIFMSSVMKDRMYLENACETAAQLVNSICT